MNSTPWSALSQYGPKNTDEAAEYCMKQVHPSHRPFVRLYQRYMWVLAILGPVFVYLQASLIILNESSDNVSLSSYIVLMIASASWLLHGVLWSNWLEMLSGLLMTCGTSVAIYAIVHYKPETQSGPFNPL